MCVRKETYSTRCTILCLIEHNGGKQRKKDHPQAVWVGQMDAFCKDDKSQETSMLPPSVSPHPGIMNEALTTSRVGRELASASLLQALNHSLQGATSSVVS